MDSTFKNSRMFFLYEPFVVGAAYGRLSVAAERRTHATAEDGSRVQLNVSVCSVSLLAAAPTEAACYLSLTLDVG